MFLKKIRSLWKTTSFRLAFGVSLLFFASSLIFFASVYVYFFHSLRDTDRTLITSKLNQYSTILKERGPEGLRKLFSDESSLKNEARFSVRIQNAQGETLFFRHSDDLNEFDIANLEKQFQSISQITKWSYIPALRTADQLEILTESLPQENLIQVGKSTSERQDFLERATEVFAIATFLSLLLGALGGYWFSKRTLMPLRDLLTTTQIISKENLNQRVKDTGDGDEFSELVKVFNSMLDRVQNLVNGMQESLDSIAHDIKTPMTRLKATADLTLSKENLNLEECRTALQECSENSGEILTLLNSLLDIYEADAGAMKLRPENFSLADLLNEVLDLYEIVADEKDMTFSNLVPNNFLIFADRLRVKQVIANLVDNAIKYSPTRSKITLRTEVRRDSWIFSVTDEGIGISSADRPYIWNRLYRGSHSRSQAGSGLGLSLVSAIMKAHGGRAWVDSTEGKGSTFQIQLPKNPSSPFKATV